jgi:hypothetical protein
LGPAAWCGWPSALHPTPLPPAHLAQGRLLL